MLEYMSECSHVGAPAMAGCTMSLPSPRGIPGWNCKIPSKSQITPKARRRRVRARGSPNPSLDRLKVLSRRRKVAPSSTRSATAMIQYTLETKTLWRKSETMIGLLRETLSLDIPGIRYSFPLLENRLRDRRQDAVDE